MHRHESVGETDASVVIALDEIYGGAADGDGDGERRFSMSHVDLQTEQSIQDDTPAFANAGIDERHLSAADGRGDETIDSLSDVTSVQKVEMLQGKISVLRLMNQSIRDFLGENNYREE